MFNRVASLSTDDNCSYAPVVLNMTAHITHIELYSFEVHKESNVTETKISYKHKTMAPINTHVYKKIRLYTQWTPTCFCQIRGRHQEYKIQSLKV